jgi:RNA polymerase sigma-70 factor (ECF subfamily)
MKEGPQNGYSEHEIIQGIKEKNEIILSYLIRKLKPKVFYWIRKQGGSEEHAEDNFQDTWLAVLINIHRGKYHEGNFEAYFKKVSKNIWINGIRNNRIELDAIKNDMKDDSEGERNLKLLKDIQYGIVCQKLMELSEECRKILVLRFYEDAELKDIADQLNISINFVPVRLYRCKRYLLELLKNDPGFRMD